MQEVARNYGFLANYTDRQYKEMAKDIKKLVDNNTQYPDWDNRDDIKSKLKVDLILLLSKYGYPPETQNVVYKEIFEQTENFKKYKN